LLGWGFWQPTLGPKIFITDDTAPVGILSSRALGIEVLSAKTGSSLHHLQLLSPTTTGVEGVVEIESEWTAQRRERMGIRLQVKIVGKPVSFGEGMENPHPSKRSV
jgi:hypothetical protein